MSHRGEIQRLAEIAEPEVGVVTRVAPVHLEFFSSVDEIALAKRELIEGLAGPKPVAVLNADDARVKQFAAVARGTVLPMACAPDAQFRAENIQDRGAGRHPIRFRVAGGRTRLELPASRPPQRFERLWPRLQPPARGASASPKPPSSFPNCPAGEMRGKLLRFAEGFAVINDSYNSNPVALEAMSELLRTPGYSRRILAAGQMLELGPNSAQLHRQAGLAAAALKLDIVVAVGDAADRPPAPSKAACLPSASIFLQRLRCRRPPHPGCRVRRSASRERFARRAHGANRGRAASWPRARGIGGGASSACRVAGSDIESAAGQALK